MLFAFIYCLVDMPSCYRRKLIGVRRQGTWCSPLLSTCGPLVCGISWCSDCAALVRVIVFDHISIKIIK